MNGPTNKLAVAHLLVVVFAAAVEAQDFRPSAIAQVDLDRAWQDLMSVDEQSAALALLKLSTRPTEAVAVIKANLRPLVLDKQRVKQLLADLAAKDAKKARAAFAEMLYLDIRLALDHKEMEDALLGPARNRVASLICELPFDWDWPEYWHWYSPDNVVFRFSYHGHPTYWDYQVVAIGVKQIGVYGRRASWIRAVRAISLLEMIGTQDARAILAEMATGHPDAAPTKAAKAALQRARNK